MEKLDRAQKIASARAADLLALAGEIGRAAVLEDHQKLLQTLAGNMLLRDIVLLREWMSATAKEELPTGLRQFVLFPQAMINWLSEHFNLEPYLNTNEVMEIPAIKLVSFDYEGETPVDVNSLVKIQVVYPGWKQGRSIVVRPFVRVL